MKLVLLTLAAALLVACLVLAWSAWWSPKTQFSCNGVPGGAESREQAAGEFVQALSQNDPRAVCRIITNRLDTEDLTTVVQDLRRDLGDPSRPEQITISLGGELGSSSPLLLRSGDYEVEVWTSWSDGWYRITLPVEP